MPHYRFHLRDDFGLVEDEEGIDLPDLASALKEALQSAREFRTDAEAASAMRFEIADEAGQVVLEVPLQIRTRHSTDHPARAQLLTALTPHG
jgi:hypothetical protein